MRDISRLMQQRVEGVEPKNQQQEPARPHWFKKNKEGTIDWNSVICCD